MALGSINEPWQAQEIRANLEASRKGRPAKVPAPRPAQSEPEQPAEPVKKELRLLPERMRT